MFDIDIEDCIKSISMNKQLSDEPVYTVKEASEKIGISAHTIRYYDKMKLFPFVKRNAANVRLFSEADLEWIRIVECLRRTNMPIHEVQHYVNLCLKGNSTIDERVKIIQKHEAILSKQIEQMQYSLQLLQFKANYYLKIQKDWQQEDLLNPIYHTQKKSKER